MAYQTGTTTDLGDLMQKLSTFAQANGWNLDHETIDVTSIRGLSKNGIFVAFQFPVAGDVIAIYQNLSNDNTVSVWASTGDSGVGIDNINPATFGNSRHINEIAGPHAAFHFFEQNANPAYIHVVVEVETNRFRHFGFGEIEKIGDWIGGEYSYGNLWQQSVSAIDDPKNASHVLGLGLGNSSNFLATMHIRGQPEQAAADRWGLIGAGSGFPQQQDRAGNDRLPCLGGVMGGMNSQMTPFRVSNLTAFKPLIPIMVSVRDTSPLPDTARLLGTWPDVRVVNMANLAPSETFVIAGETWFVFPWARKQFLKNDTEESWNGGLAYRQELA